MFGFFKSSRVKATSANPASDAVARPQSQASGARLAEAMPSSRDLVRIVFRDTLRRNGIPSDWLACQISTHSQPAKPPIHQIQVVVVKWHESLLRFAPLLEQQLLHGLQQMDPDGDHSRHAIVWSFAPNCGCPYTSLPPSTYWQAEALKRKFDLPPSPRSFHEVDADFATTTPGSLN